MKSFKYLVAKREPSWGMDKEINNLIQCGWNNWRKVTSVICGRRVLIQLKGKVYREVVRPAVMYVLEAAALKQAEKKLDVTERKMLRWMARLDIIRNEYIRGSAKVVELSKRVHGARLRWFGQLMRRRDDEEHTGREAMDMELPGTWRRGKPIIR